MGNRGGKTSGNNKNKNNKNNKTGREQAMVNASWVNSIGSQCVTQYVDPCYITIQLIRCAKRRRYSTLILQSVYTDGFLDHYYIDFNIVCLFSALSFTV